MFLFLSGMSVLHAACLPWHKARVIIKQNGLINAGTIRQKTKRYGGKITQLALCDVGGRYVYQVRILVPGKVKSVLLDARSGTRVKGGVSIPADVGAGSGKVLQKIRPRFRRFVPRQFRKRFFRKRYRRR